MDSSSPSVSPFPPDLRARVFERTVRPHAVRNARMAWPERTSLVIALTDVQGHVGLGEAAPLPGVSRETLDDARAELVAMAEAPHAAHAPSCASVRFAWGCAQLDLVSQRSGIPAWAHLAQDVPATLECNALLNCAPDRWRDEIEALMARGVRTVKLKVGFEEIGIDAHVDALLALDMALPADIRLRLDANGAFDADEAALFRAALVGPRYEYVEDPVTSHALHTLSGSGLRWAADQLYLDAPAAVMASGARDGLAALILKPTLLGAPTELVRIVTEARAHAVDVVLTHAFEGPIAHAALVHLAFVVAAIGTPRAMGLATHDVLRLWPFVAPAHEWELERPQRAGLGLDAPRLLRWLESDG